MKYYYKHVPALSDDFHGDLQRRQGGLLKKGKVKFALSEQAGGVRKSSLTRSNILLVPLGRLT